MRNNFLVISATCFLTLLLFSCKTNPVVPAAIQVAPTDVFAFYVTADGYQTYRCDSIAPDKYEWVGTPTATLTDTHGAVIGKHYKGTGVTWESTVDGSKVVAKKIAETPAAAPNSIPWFLLEATEHGEKTGIFSKVTKVQRVDTKDGLKPAEVPSKSIQGKVVPVHYTATYNFYTAN